MNAKTMVLLGLSTLVPLAAVQASVIPGDRVPVDRPLPWDPGIKCGAGECGADGIPFVTTVCGTVSASLGTGTGNAATGIQSVIDSAACAGGGVVMLPAGTYRITQHVSITRNNLVLRGALGPAGEKLSKIILDNGNEETAVFMGPGVYYNPGVNLTGGFGRGSTSLTTAGGGGFSPGDLVVVDQLDDGSLVQTGDCDFFKRTDDGDRSLAQIVEVAGVSGNVLQISDPLYMPYTAARIPQVAKLSNAAVKKSGVENLYLTRKQVYDQGFLVLLAGTNSCWVKNVEAEKGSGRSIALWGSHRSVVRDSYVHEAWDYDSNGAQAEGIDVGFGSSDCLVENNVVIHFERAIATNASGGGNVIGYNYIDESEIAQSPGYQMPGVACHCSYSHMNLMEGNWTAMMGSDFIHGNSGYETFYRNNLRGQDIIPNSGGATYGNLVPIELGDESFNMNVAGNVLGRSGATGTYEGDDNTAYNLGQDVKPALYRHGNYDYYTKAVHWDADSLHNASRNTMDPVSLTLVSRPIVTDTNLPDSLYLASKPAFFGALPWPFVNPSGGSDAGRVGHLPAKDRYDGVGAPPPDAMPPAKPKNLRVR